MMKRIAEWFALTGSERKIFIFLAAVLLCGACIKLFQEMFPSGERFDYNVSDSVFISLGNAKIDSTALSIGPSSGPEKKSKLNINTASREELMELPGVGRVTAERIIEYRKLKGRFEKIEGLLDVKGIGRVKLERLRQMISTQ
jgi:competence ComEA-like helix-hairpin-helix protein